jgi:hypothetical protein
MKTSSEKVLIPKKKRKGIHSKSKTSNNKSSKLYAKKYRGQGK